MGTLIAKTKGRDGDYFKVLTGEDFFEMPEDVDEHEYDVNYLLDEEEWYSITDFSEQDYCPGYLKEPFNSVDYNQLKTTGYNKIDHFFEYQSGIYYYQRVSSAQLMRKSYLQISQAPRILKDRRLITLDANPNAIYLKKRNVLLFKNLFSISTIFKGIDEIYKEATNEEIEDFLENDFIELADDYSADKVKRANRKRITSAIKSLEGMTRKEREGMFKYIQEYCPNLPVNDSEDAFAVSDETSLKHLLYGIEERFYTTQRSQEKRLANSVTSKW